MGIRFRFADDAERKQLEDFVEKLMSEKLGGHVAAKLLGQALSEPVRPDVPAAYPRPVMASTSRPRSQRLKKERNAVLLAHYYQESEIQDVADFIGDSLQLAQAAAKTKADVICFAGVHFMAETAKILNPERTVVLPGPRGGLLARRAAARRTASRAWIARHPGAVVVSYINCTAEVKALSRLHRHVVERREDRPQHPRGQDGPLRAGQEPRRVPRRRRSAAR